MAIESFWQTANKLRRHTHAELLSILGTTTTSIIVFSFAVPVLTSVATAIHNIPHEPSRVEGTQRSLAVLLIHSALSYPTLISIGITVLAWFCLISAATARAADHAYSRLTTENDRLRLENFKLKASHLPPPNLRLNFDSAPLGLIFLTPEGVWSASYSPSAAKWSGLRLKVANIPIEGKKVSPAKDVSVRVKFEHDTGLDGACAAPTAWLHERLGHVDLAVGEEKEAIIAVRRNRDWYTVTNVRDESGYPANTSAMRFQGAPWFSGKLHIGLILNGEVTEQHYSWEVTEPSVVPRIRKIPSTGA